jgi:hypothetical protein
MMGVYGTTLHDEPLPSLVDITGALKLKDYNLMKKCIVGLGEIAWGINWDEHMVVAGLEIREQWEADGEIEGEKISYNATLLFEWEGSNVFFSR